MILHAIRGSTANFTALILVVALGCMAREAWSAELEKSALLEAKSVTAARSKELKREGYSRLAIMLVGNKAEEKRAVVHARAAGLATDYFIEVARDEELAKVHPLLQASLQGHPGWRKSFPNVKLPGPTEVVKAYPWVPIGYREAFELQRKKVASRLEALPPPERLYLNDLQGAPSACGCGSPLCRWTTDYGPKRTTELLGDGAPGNFLVKVRDDLRHTTEVIPIVTTECESHDGHADGICNGIPCYDGRCWKDFGKQMETLWKDERMIGLLAFYREFGQDTTTFRDRAGWLAHVARHAQKKGEQNGLRKRELKDYLLVLQGWDASTAELAQQSRMASEGGVGGVLIALDRVAQTFEPRLLTLPGK